MLLALPLLLLGSFYFFSTPQLEELRAAAGNNLRGFAWSSTLGWISFNSINCDTDDNGVSDGARPGCPSAGSPIARYGVGVELPARGSKKLSGYAWASNIGYITFNEPELSGCPDTPCKAEVNFATGAVQGWARACSVFQGGCSGSLRAPEERGGWDGWIHLSGTSHLSPEPNGSGGVTLDTATCTFTGYAWGGAGSEADKQSPGWIRFRGTAQDNSSYGVEIANPNQTPDTPDNLSLSSQTDPESAFCPAPWLFVFSFRYEDPDENDMGAYELQISNNGTFAGPDIVYDTGQNILSSPSGQTVAVARSFCSPSQTLGCGGASVLSFNQDYWWRVKTWDSGLAVCRAGQSESAWSAAAEFRTPAHDWPRPDFHTIPETPVVEKTVKFKNDTRFDESSANQSFHWTFSGAAPATDTSREPSRVYRNQGIYNTTLRASDDVGSCERIKSISILPPPPKFREIPPR